MIPKYIMDSDFINNYFIYITNSIIHSKKKFLHIYNLKPNIDVNRYAGCEIVVFIYFLYANLSFIDQMYVMLVSNSLQMPQENCSSSHTADD